MAGDIVNGSFGDGLTGWRIVSGAGFRNQPVQAAGIGAQDVLIDGSPLVTLGGDYWHTNAFPLGQDGPALIRVVTEEDGNGVLDSVPFTITQRYLAYRLGGTAGGDAALEVRIPHNDLPPSRRALDKPDKEGYVAVLAVSPDGSDILSEDVIDLIGPDASPFVLGLETDTINGWSKFSDFPFPACRGDRPGRSVFLVIGDPGPGRGDSGT